MRTTRFRLQHIKSFSSTGWVELGPITILVGANNSGKSTLLRGLGLMQVQQSPLGKSFTMSDDSKIRLEADLVGLTSRFWPSSSGVIPEGGGGLLAIDYLPETYNIALTLQNHEVGPGLIPNVEPHNYIYPYLSKRKVLGLQESVNLNATMAVSGDLTNLVAKIDRLSNPSHPDYPLYIQMCESVIGFPVTSFASANGKRAGLVTGRFSNIGLDDMGEGVSSLLGLIVDLCVADSQLFLIEELENDVHPAALKALLELIAQRSRSNQFVISTHSNIVTRHLGSIDGTVIQKVEMERIDGLPNSRVNKIGNSPAERIAVLSELGYELRDFDLWDGWLFLEESSAERLLRDFLIPWFAPQLTGVRTLAVGGVSKAEPTFADFDRLFKFTHLEQTYRGRAWVVLDGDEVGIAAVDNLRARYSAAWTADHFRTWSERDFEHYYPDRFQDAVKFAFAKTRQERRDAKKALLDEVVDWVRTNEEVARAEFEVSAVEVIAVLVEIQSALGSKRY